MEDALWQDFNNYGPAPIQKTSSVPNISDEQCVELMKKGTRMIKVRGKSWYKIRNFRLEDEGFYIRYHPSRKAKSRNNFVAVRMVHEIRTGYNTDVFRHSNKCKPNLEPQAFSLIIGKTNKSLDLIAANKVDVQVWIRGLRYLLKEKLNFQQQQIRWIKTYFNIADKNNDKVLNFDETVKLLKRMNIQMNKKQVSALFDAADTKITDGPKVLDIDEFVEFYEMLTERHDIKAIMNESLTNSDNQSYISVEKLKDFLQAEQGWTDVSDETCEAFIATYETNEAALQESVLTLSGFTKFLLSEHCAILDTIHRTVHQNMTLPLSYYYISSSHNTYLEGDQLVGKSSVESYIRVLQKGCRCVELDIWDGTDGEPIIYHGHTLTTKIYFKDVISAIKEYAFTASPYPLILSFENHCSVRQQETMANHLRNILGEMMFDGTGTWNELSLPSPERLKHRIIIKGKKLASHSEEEVSDEDETAETEQNVRSPPKIRLAKQLSDMVSVIKSTQFKNFRISEASFTCHECCSLNENRAQQLSVSYPNEMKDFNKRNIFRIFPAGSRADSSNYNPVPLWNAGCQIVALNWQTGDQHMDINRGLFQSNGHCGYVLKPRLLLDDETYDPTKIDWSVKSLHITIISANQLPKTNSSDRGEIIDPYVQLHIVGVAQDCTWMKTKTVVNNGFNPVWNTSMLFQISTPELAIARFAVFDDDPGQDDFIGQYSIPVWCMGLGFRHVPLLTKDGDVIPKANIFIHVRITD